LYFKVFFKLGKVCRNRENIISASKIYIVTVEAIVIGHHVIIKTVNCVLEGQTEGTLAA
jgi:hypothetical protein